MFFQIPALISLLLTFQESMYCPYESTITVIAHNSAGMLNKLCGRESFKSLLKFPRFCIAFI